MSGAVGVCPPPATAPFENMIGINEGTVGDDVLMRFGEVVVQVPPDMLEPVEGQ